MFLTRLMRIRIPLFIIKVGAVALVILLIGTVFKPGNELGDDRLDSLGVGTSPSLRVGIDGVGAAYQHLQDMNIHWVREEIPWMDVEMIPGQYQWAFNDGDVYQDISVVLDQAAEHDLEVLAVLDTGPAYLPHQYPDQPVNADELVLRWQAYVQAVVDRYGQQIDYWEIGNEINNPAAWGNVLYPTVPGAQAQPQPFLYARMLSTAYQIIKENNPRDVVVLGGLLGSSSNDCSTSLYSFLIEIKNAGAWQDFDVLGVHPYWENNPPEAWMYRGPGINLETGICDPGLPVEANLMGELRTLRNFTRRYGEKPIWVTEIGWREDWLNALASTQGMPADQYESNYLVRSIVPILSEEGMRKVFWNGLYEDPDKPGFALGPLGQQALANIGRLLGGARVLGQNQSGTDLGTPQDLGVYEYRFRKEGRVIIYAWNASGGATPYPVEFSGLPGNRYRAYAADTSDLSAEAGMEIRPDKNGTITIYLTEFPVILIQDSQNLFASLEHRISDGMATWWDKKQDQANVWVDAQFEKMGDKALDLAQRMFYKLTNWLFERLEEQF